MLILHESTRMSVTMVRKNSRVSYIWMRIGIRTITVKQPSSKLTKMIMKLLLKSDRNMGDWLSLMVSSFYCRISWLSNIIDSNFSKSIKIYFLSPFSTKVVYTGNTWSAFSYTETDDTTTKFNPIKMLDSKIESRNIWTTSRDRNFWPLQNKSR